jgi:Uma2 family endonuclease
MAIELLKERSRMVIAKLEMKLIEVADDGIAIGSPPELLEPAIGEQRLMLTGISWDGYLQILDALPQTRAVRLTYDGGLLEFAMPLEKHESFNELIRMFIWTLVDLMGLSLKSMGSTTMNYPGLGKGSEPDCSYYIQNQPIVKGRTVDFSQDPPPDLVVEVDITHTDIQKNKFYAAIGVPEFWRFNGKVWRIYQLQSGEYWEVQVSPTFPQVPKDWLYQFLTEAAEDEMAAVRSLRRWWSELQA